MLSNDWALGLDASGLENKPGIGLSHPAAGAALQRLMTRARRSGFELAVASGYRGYSRQLTIFNEKFRCQRPVCSDQGHELSRSAFDEAGWLRAILRYSALPGTSRHHWGTDFDVWDSRAVGEDYKLLLQGDEYAGDGPFAALSAWLSQLIDRDDAEGFYRPYDTVTDGVAIEPWHLSHRPTAQLFYPLVTDAQLRSLWLAGEQTAAGGCSFEPLAAQAVLEDQFEEVMARFVRSYYE